MTGPGDVVAMGEGRGRRGSGPGGAPDYDDDYDDEDEASRSAPVAVLRWVALALVAVVVALGIGVGLAFGWQKVHPSDKTASSGATTGTPASTPATAPASTAPTAAPTAGARTTVPATWAAVTDPAQQATFSHPAAWKERRDNTGLFFAETGAGASGFGAQMVGVARETGKTPAQALQAVQASEFANLPGYRQERFGPVVGGDGTTAQEFVAVYTREGQPVEYVMRAVPGTGASYVLITRSTATPAGGAENLQRILTASFKPS